MQLHDMTKSYQCANTNTRNHNNLMSGQQFSDHLIINIGSVGQQYDISIPYLCFFCFNLSLKPFCNPSLAPWPYTAQRRLASDEKKVSIFQSDTVIVLVHEAMFNFSG